MLIFGQQTRANPIAAPLFCRCNAIAMDGIVAFNHANGTELGLHIGINTGWWSREKSAARSPRSFGHGRRGQSGCSTGRCEPSLLARTVAATELLLSCRKNFKSAKPPRAMLA